MPTTASYVRCTKCGARCSRDVEGELVVQAYIECITCIEGQADQPQSRYYLNKLGRVDSDEWLPDAAIPLAGFPICKGDGNSCLQEVEDSKTFCSDHGGPEPSPEILKRTYLRQLRTAVASLLACADCRDKDPRGARCLDCAFYSGAAYALGGLMERRGWRSLSEPVMKLIFVRRP